MIWRYIHHEQSVRASIARWTIVANDPNLSGYAKTKLANLARELIVAKDHGGEFLSESDIDRIVENAIKKTDWFPGSVVPIHRGLYERDWTNTDILPVEERKINMDFWEPVPYPFDACFPGIWYVLPEFNDATWQQLPWRGVKNISTTV